MGTSLAMIDRTYGHLIRGSEAATIDRMKRAVKVYGTCMARMRRADEAR